MGGGSHEDLLAAFQSSNPQFGYARNEAGKFLFISLVPDSLSGLKKIKVQKHKGEVGAFLKDVHAAVVALEAKDLRRQVEIEANKIRNSMSERPVSVDGAAAPGGPSPAAQAAQSHQPQLARHARPSRRPAIPGPQSLLRGSMA